MSCVKVMVQNSDLIIKIHQNPKGKVYINDIKGFWSFVKENMAKYHGVSPSKFLLYIKEMETQQQRQG